MQRRRILLFHRHQPCGNFYVIKGDSSSRDFLDGKTFSFNDKDDPGKTLAFIDDMTYESIGVESAA